MQKQLIFFGRNRNAMMKTSFDYFLNSKYLIIDSHIKYAPRVLVTVQYINLKLFTAAQYTIRDFFHWNNFNSLFTLLKYYKRI